MGGHASFTPMNPPSPFEAEKAKLGPAPIIRRLGRPRLLTEAEERALIADERSARVVAAEWNIPVHRVYYYRTQERKRQGLTNEKHERQHGRKLTVNEQDEVAISTRSATELAREYGVSVDTIRYHRRKARGA